MGTRGEGFSTKGALDKRTYFFNVKENRMGDLFVSIVESKKSEDSLGYERPSIVLFKDDMQSFLKGLDECLRFLEKEGKGKRAPRGERPREREADGNRPASKGDWSIKGHKPRFEGRLDQGGRPGRDEGQGARAAYKKKIVAKKPKPGEGAKAPRSLVRKAVRVRKKEGPAE